MDLINKDKEFIANTYNRFPVVMIEGKGSLVWDETGKKYIDMGTGIGVNSFGFSDDEWKAAVIEQLGKLQHASNLYYTEPCISLAERLCEKTGMKKVFFSNSGAEANECAIKVARKWAEDKYGEDTYTIITLTNSFHGRTLATLAATGQEVFHEKFTPMPEGFISVPIPAAQGIGDVSAEAQGADGAAEEMLATLRSAAEQNKIAAVMIECVQGEGGVIPLPEETVKAITNFVREKDILLIVDEVQTGNGRTGKLYSYMHFGLAPDIVSTAKGLGGGLPIGATLLGERTKDVLQAGDHGSTFGGNPLACAGALSVLKRLDEAFLSRVEEKSQYIFKELEGTKGIKSVSGKGLMIGVETEKPAAEVVKECIERGVIFLTAKTKVRMLPALNIPMEELKQAIQILKEVCAN